MANKLPKKEADLFRQLVDCYEKKNYKKGIKTADTILKKFPNNGETQAMKGIIMNSMGKKSEAYELVKAGLKNDVRSHVCWHVYGLLYRSDNNYKEAIKCYLNALRIDPGNQNILRDLSWLQMQMRDMTGFLTTRRTILESRSTARASWVAFAVANFVNKQYSAAFEVLSKYHENVSEKGDAYEESELLLFQALCLRKANKFDEELLHLESCESKVVDKLAWRVMRAELFTLLGKVDLALSEWESLVFEQSENYKFHRGLQATLLRFEKDRALVAFSLTRMSLPSNTFVLSADERQTLLNWYSAQSKKSRTIEKIVLSLLEGEELVQRLQLFVQKMLFDGVPSLCHDVCSLVTMVDKQNPAYLELVTTTTEFKNHFIVVKTFDIISSITSQVVPPISVLWARYLEAHLLEKCGQLSEALVKIESAASHTPTAVDILVKKAHLHKKLGRYVDAAILMDDVRALDLQDRYLNNKAAKYFLRADQEVLAINTISMFTKHEGDPEKTLYDLQCSWFELELAESYARQKKWGLALKKFGAIKAHFEEQYDDLFDFHGYCIRKTTLRAYLDVINVQDTSFAHKNYQRALHGALTIYLHLLDCPEDVDGLGHLSPADRKKERAKQKKKKQSENGVAAVVEDGKDSDPDGELLLQKDFLSEATHWVTHIQSRLHLCDCETLALFAEIMTRKGKHLQAVRAFKLASDRPDFEDTVLPTFVRYALRLKNKKFNNVNAVVMAVVKQEVAAIMNLDTLSSLADFVDNFVNKSVERRSFSNLLSVIKVLNIADKNNLARLSEILAKVDWIAGNNVGVVELTKMLAFLITNYDDRQIWKGLFDEGQAAFSLADYFTQVKFEDRKDMTRSVTANDTTPEL